MIYHANANGFRDLLEHNFRMSRPSFEPASNSDAAPRYAHLGKVMKKADVLVARAEERALRGGAVPSVDFFSAPDLSEQPRTPPQVSTRSERDLPQPEPSEGRGQIL
jgi:hypothetical protein